MTTTDTAAHDVEGLRMKICTIEGCDRIVRARGWCSTHWLRWRKHGSPFIAEYRSPQGTAKRFLEEVAIPFTGDECLPWPFSSSDGGYGRIWLEGKAQSVSRLVCTAAHGKAPSPRHIVAHGCGSGHLGCCNPRHLRWATYEENEADKAKHGTKNVGSRNHAAKLTESDVRQIWAMKGKVPVRELARRYSVRRDTIDAIYSGKRWKHVTARAVKGGGDAGE